jgi:uncharacterized membrane protein (UPF0127 family)
VGVLLLLGAVTFVVKAADRPADPVLEDAPVLTTGVPTSTATARGAVAGFGEIAYRIDKMSAVSRCALLADTPARESQGLMNRRDLAGHDGMLFVFPTTVSNSFYMKNTLIPLSIAWFDERGKFVSATDMEPCPPKTVECPLFSAAGPYKYALEVQKGGLPGLGIGPGSTITPGGACS